MELIQEGQEPNETLQNQSSDGHTELDPEIDELKIKLDTKIHEFQLNLDAKAKNIEEKKLVLFSFNKKFQK